jgi:Cof subfamily protein (haloacid dehalogenase superfamily)
MNIKMVAIDLDGTLLDDDKNVSRENVIAIKKAINAGVKVIICTGRILPAALCYADEAGLNDLIVACNGGYIYDFKNKKEINNEYIDKDSVKKAINIFHNEGIYFHAYIDNCLVVEKMEYDAREFYEHNKRISKKYAMEIKLVDNVLEYFNNGNGTVNKFVSVWDDIAHLSKVRNQISSINTLEITSSNESNFEIMKKGVTKGKGVMLAAKYLNINLDEVMAIGDSENDTTILDVVGFPVVMENASDIIKEKGKFITKTNTENGVAYAIEKFVLK